MGRRSGVEGLLRAAIRATVVAERERKRAARAELTQERQLERQRRMALAQQNRDERATQKRVKAQYLAGRQSGVNALNARLQEQMAELRCILMHALSVDSRIDFAALRPAADFEPFMPPPELAPGQAPHAPVMPPPPSGLLKLIPGSARKHAAALAKTANDHQLEVTRFNQVETAKREQLARLKAQYDQRKGQFEMENRQSNAEIDAFQAAYHAKEYAAVVAYNEIVLSRSKYPVQGFSQEFRIAYNPDALELIVEYTLPEVGVIPKDEEYRYIKTRNAVESKARKPMEIKQLYRDIVASITLRTLHELFEADQGDALALITFNGMVNTRDPANGHEIQVPIVSMRVAKREFLCLRLENVDKLACLQNLGAQISSRPDELQAIKPIVEFDQIEKLYAV